MKFFLSLQAAICRQVILEMLQKFDLKMDCHNLSALIINKPAEKCENFTGRMRAYPVTGP
jgi:hypothetical protein